MGKLQLRLPISLLVFFLLAAGLWGMGQSSFFWETLLKKFAGKTMAALGIEDIAIGQARLVWHFSTRQLMVICKDIRVSVKDPDQTSGHIETLTVRFLNPRWTWPQLFCDARNISWRGAGIHLSNGHAKMRINMYSSKDVPLKGQLRAEKLRIGPWNMEGPRVEILFQPMTSRTFLQDFSARITITGNPRKYDLGWKATHITKKETGWRVECFGGVLDGQDLKVEHLDFALSLNDFRSSSLSADGHMTLASWEWEGYQGRHFQSRIGLTGRTITFQDLSGEAWGGQIFGEFSLDYSPQLPYSVSMSFQEWDMARMEHINPSIFSQVRGLYNGHFQMKGLRQGMTEISGRITGVSGMQIKAALIESLMSIIPGLQMLTLQSRWEDLVVRDAFMPVDFFKVDWQSEGREKITGNLQLLSREINFSDVTFDINYEAGLRGPGYYLKKIKRSR
jgi:hypothetical protein